MQQAYTSPHAVLRRRQVEVQTGLSRSTLYLRVQKGLWTKPVNLGGRLVGWPVHEVEALITARIAGSSDQQIRDLVRTLEEARRPKRPKVAVCVLAGGGEVEV